jgi:hypothetical protein
MLPGNDLTGIFGAQLDTSLQLSILRNGLTTQLRLTRDSVVVNLAASFQHWHHIVQTSNGATVLTYLDSVLANTNNAANPRSLAGTYYIGRSAAGLGSIADTWVSEAAVYPTALSPSRITAHFLAIDSLIAAPVYRQFSSGASGGGGGSGPSGADLLADLAAILAAVRRTY